MMKVALGTSVLVAALVGAHRHHARARCWLLAMETGQLQGTASWHAMSETWSVLTRLPVTPKIAPHAAWAAVRRLRTMLDLVPPTEHIYRAALARCTARQLTSGVVFDALHVVTAEEVRADALLTFNHAEFARLVDKERPRIVVPPDPPRGGPLMAHRRPPSGSEAFDSACAEARGAKADRRADR
ncbi:type II toxin-antitoxin system VapC family toxin [Sorangium sp. So ce1036]|uniref:type II toxin-antitoxin system VapC family toxin n=1 Tax=Sorangium sp. So ce1036 TaxID=3133328 RepID=UPI003F1291A6